MDTSIHVIQPFVAPAVHDRKRKEREAKPFELAIATTPAASEPESKADQHELHERIHEEGLGHEIDVVA